MVFCNLGGAFASLIVYDVGLDYSFRAMFLFLSPFALSGAILAFYFKLVTFTVMSGLSTKHIHILMQCLFE